MADLLLRDTEPDALASVVAEIVMDRLRPLLSEAREPRLVDRYRMAELLSVSVPKLDRLVSEGVIPSKLIGKRRLFEPAAVIAAVPNEKGPAHD